MPSMGQVNSTYGDVWINAETFQWRLCLRADCDQCVSSPKLIAYHPDCYRSFRVLWKRNEIDPGHPSYISVYEMGSSLSPWFPPAEKFQIYLNTGGAFEWWRWGLKEAVTARPVARGDLGDFVISLYTLPVELLGHILIAGGRDIYRSALLRHVLVTHVASAISEQAKLRQNKLGNGAHACKPIWGFLGNQYAISKEDAATAQLLGMDHLGIRATSNDCPWYLEKGEVELCDEPPFLRPSLSRQLKLWDVSKRPEEGSYRFYGADEDKSNPQQIRCINLSDCVGLTFVCAGRVVHGIYAHQKDRDLSAVDIYLSLRPPTQKVALLRYFPLNESPEMVNEIWVRESQPLPELSRAIVMRTSRGTYIFGPHHPHREYQYVQLAGGLATSLLYHIPARGDPIAVFGAVSQSASLQLTSEPPVITSRGDAPLIHCSQASLENVAHVELYIHTLEEGRCGGMLIKHNDGHEEALGQRRIGISTIQTIRVSRPCQIHYKRGKTPDGCSRLHVNFSTNDDPECLVDEAEGWVSKAMTGTIVWFLSWSTDKLQFGDAE